MADFKPEPKERGDVILAEDWNSAMDEIVRLGGDLDTQTLKRTGGMVQGDLNVAGSVTTGGKVGIGTSDPQAALDVAGGAIVMRQAADPNSAGALLDKLPNGSLLIGGPSGENLMFFWKDENGKKYQLSLKGEALTG